MVKDNDIQKGKLAGYAYYSKVHSPQKDEKRKQYQFKTTLVLEHPDGKPVVLKDTKTGEEINMIKEAKRLGLKVKTAKDETKLQELIGERKFVDIGKKKKFADYDALPEDKQKAFMKPIPVKFRKGFKALDQDTLIGNASFVVVSFSAIPYDFEGNEGVQAYIQGMSVVNLVSFQQDFEEDTFDFDGVEMTDPNSEDDFNFGEDVDMPSDTAKNVTVKKPSKTDKPFDDDINLE